MKSRMPIVIVSGLFVGTFIGAWTGNWYALPAAIAILLGIDSAEAWYAWERDRHRFQVENCVERERRRQRDAAEYDWRPWAGERDEHSH